MTKKEYAEYEAAVAEFFEREGVANLSTGPLDDTEGTAEPYFSWGRCECCGTTLGGNREDAHGYNPTTKEVQHFVICEDCVYYAEYGRLDDMTMMEIEKNAE